MRRLLLTFVGLTCYALAALAQITITGKVTDAEDGLGLPRATILVKGTNIAVPADADGRYSISVPDKSNILVFRFLGYVTQEIKVGTNKLINVTMRPDALDMGEVVVTGYGTVLRSHAVGMSVSSVNSTSRTKKSKSNKYVNESYAKINENTFHRLDLKPLSTFGVDVDKAAYANVRRMINGGNLPDKDAVRIEEMINYFEYDYPQPTDARPFSVHTEYTACPWEPNHQLLKIGIQGKYIAKEEVPKHNLVFLIDVSGSMSSDNKLPLVQKSLKLLVKKLRPQDQVAIVVYAGAAGAVLQPTEVRHKERIIAAINRLESGGSTAGGQGLELAYDLAEANFDKESNNRIILATDGDFNVGQSSDGAMERLIESRRDKGIYLTCLGYGMGNFKDSKLETLADKGNGNYAYIDDIWEARKVLIDEMNGTLLTIAKDVKIQVEFNPEQVAAYRLIGYENRLLEDEDFRNDTKDAGDLGAGQQVTAIYEIIPVDVKSKHLNQVDRLRYGKLKKLKKQFSTELGVVKLRYKAPDSRRSVGFKQMIGLESQKFEQCSEDLRFTAAVAMFGMILRNSEFKANSSLHQVAQMAESTLGEDPNGLRSEFRNLVTRAITLYREPY